MVSNLERLALLGDQKAQRECTRNRIMLPCPLCRRRVRYYFSPKHEEGTKGDIIVIPDMSYVKCVCGYSVSGYGENAAIEIHNKRPRPLIGKCKDCSKMDEAIINDYGILTCPTSGMEIDDDDFCSYFKPRNGEIDYDRPRTTCITR